MEEPSSRSSSATFLITAAAFVIVIAGMRAAQSLLVPFLLSVFLAVICSPPLFWLKRRGVPTSCAVLIVVVGILAVGLFIAALVGTSLGDFSDSLPFYEARLKEETAALLGWLKRLGLKVPEAQVSDSFDLVATMRLAAGVLAALGKVLTNAFLIVLTVVFILFEASSFPAKLRLALGESWASRASFEKFTHNLRRYMAIKTCVSAVTGIAVALWLTVLGVDYALLWGVLAFLLNYVPNIGSIIAGVPAVLLAFIQHGTGSAALAAVGYLVINLVIGNLVEPRFMGRGLGLSTLVVFLSLVFWGWVLGPVGMLLSVPLTVSVKIALDSSEETRWIAVLLGSQKPAEPASSRSTGQ